MTGWESAVWARSNLAWAALFDAEAELAALDADADGIECRRLAAEAGPE